jgi:putative redox protein
MQVRIKWLEQRSFQAETGSGHTLMMDGPPEHGGQNTAARPMEMILVGLGGCSAFDVVEILEKSRQNVEDCQIEIDAERADEVPAVFTTIHMRFIISGQKLNEKHVKRAVELSVEKYCSVAKMMRPNVTITFDYEIIGKLPQSTS